jgi:hypothetical protein
MHPEEPSEMPRDPNAGVYRKTETRTGPPLDYVAEKLRSCLEMIHGTVWAVQRFVPDDLPTLRGVTGAGFDAKNDGLLSPAFSAFRHGVIACLALNNMLAAATDGGLFEHLLGLPSDQFREWLDSVDREGVVSG